MERNSPDSNRYAALIILLILLAVAVALSEEGALGMPSGDPTIEVLTGEAGWNAGTEVASSPRALTRLGGKVGIDVCYYYDPGENPCVANPAWCPACPDWEPGKTISLVLWCQRLDALPMPQPPLPGDKRPVCDPAWKL